MDRNLHLVSVIMNCLNGEKWLREAIDSVYAQTNPHWEIIFWDNASSDSSAAIARSYDSRLRYFRGEETVPLGAARNMAMARARGEFIAFLDCDDLWLPTKLEKQIFLFDDPKVGLVFSDAIYFNNRGDCRLQYDRLKYATGACFPALLSNYYLCLSTVVIRRKCLDAEREWVDPSLTFCEEADLFMRIAYRWHLAMVNEPLAKYRRHGSSIGYTKFYLQAQEGAAILAKYHEIFPDFAKQFSSEIRILKKNLDMLNARYHWFLGQPRTARSLLSRYIFLDKTASILYFRTFFPPNTFNFLYPVLSKFGVEVGPIMRPSD